MNDRKTLKRIASALEAHAPAASPRDSSRTKKVAPKSPIIYRARVAFQCSADKSERATSARRTFPIMGYVGPNGGGKSAAMVKDTMPSLAAGRKVLSTVTLLDPATGEPHENYIRFTDWAQLLDAYDCDVLMDEMVGIASSRESQKLPVQIQNILVQLRRRNVVLRWSAPNWARADKIIREVTQAVTECRGFYADRSQTRDDSTAVKLWAPKRLFSFRTFDTVDFEEWTAGKRDRVQPMVSEWFHGVGSQVFESYNTLDAVESVGTPSEAGLCLVCGGLVRNKPCSCGKDHAAVTPVPVHSHKLLEELAESSVKSA